MIICGSSGLGLAFLRLPSQLAMQAGPDCLEMLA